MYRICAGVAGVLVLVFGLARAQTAEPVFAAASIKPVIFRRPSAVVFKPGGRLTAIGVAVSQLVRAAYGVPPGSERLGKGPDWIDSEKFDVEAVAEEGVIPDRLDNAQLRERMQPLLQRLLAERFKLVIRREPKEMPVYMLTAATPGAKLTEALISETECQTSVECHQVLGNRLQGLRGAAVNMADLALALETSTDRPVVNATGIIGLFSVQIRPFADMKPMDASLATLLATVPEDRRPPPEPFKPSLSSVLEKDFGLLLRPARASIETIKIESVQRPSAN